MPGLTEHAVAGSVLAGLLSAGSGMAKPVATQTVAPYAQLVLGDDASCWIVVMDPQWRNDSVFVELLLDLGPPPPGGRVWADMPEMGTALKGWRDDAPPEQNAELARPACEEYLARYDMMTGAN